MNHDNGSWKSCEMTLKFCLHSNRLAQRTYSLFCIFLYPWTYLPTIMHHRPSADNNLWPTIYILPTIHYFLSSSYLLPIANNLSPTIYYHLPSATNYLPTVPRLSYHPPNRTWWMVRWSCIAKTLRFFAYAWPASLTPRTGSRTSSARTATSWSCQPSCASIRTIRRTRCSAKPSSSFASSSTLCTENHSFFR